MLGYGFCGSDLSHFFLLFKELRSGNVTSSNGREKFLSPWSSDSEPPFHCEMFSMQFFNNTANWLTERNLITAAASS